MSLFDMMFRSATRRRGARKPARLEAESVFKSFVRALERLRGSPRGGGPAAIGATREKA